MSDFVLQAKGVGKTYQMGGQPLTVLSGVDLTLERGEFVALQGASGSGKSTLLQLLGGLDAPSEGEIFFNNQPLRLQSPVDAAIFRGQHIGFVFQAYHLLPDLDALENVCLPALVQRAPQAKAEARARELLAAVGLADRMTHLPTELSGGEQQRVAIARALMNEPEIILADEPTGNLDTGTEAEIIALLAQLHREHNLTLLVATHDDVVSAAAQRIVRLKDGRVAD